MSKNDTRILHIYYLAEIFLFFIIKVGEQVWRKPGQGDPGFPGSPLAILRYCTIICNFLMILYLYLRHGHRFHFRENLIPLAFAFTLTADYFMCIICGKRILGYLFFTLVETVYMIYMKPTWKTISVRLVIYAAILLLILIWHAEKLTADNRTISSSSPSHFIYNVAAFIVWTCYIPSQIFLLRSYVEKIVHSGIMKPESMA